MKTLITFICLILSSGIFAQSVINGNVTDTNDQPIPGANVYLDGTYDGDTTDDKGDFSFDTAETGHQILTISYLSYETKTIVADVSTLKNLKIKLREDVETLDGVIITAGTFEANDNSKVSVLKPT